MRRLTTPAAHGPPPAQPPPESLTQDIFRRVDTDASGLISFGELARWWARQQLATTGAMDEEALRTLKVLWEEVDADQSGELDVGEFELVLARMAASGWVEAMDPGTGRVYYYNKKTRETRWEAPDLGDAVGELLAEQGLDVGRPGAVTGAAVVGTDTASASAVPSSRPPSLDGPAVPGGGDLPAPVAVAVNGEWMAAAPQEVPVQSEGGVERVENPAAVGDKPWMPEEIESAASTSDAAHPKAGQCCHCGKTVTLCGGRRVKLWMLALPICILYVGLLLLVGLLILEDSDNPSAEEMVARARQARAAAVERGASALETSLRSSGKLDLSELNNPELAAALELLGVPIAANRQVPLNVAGPKEVTTLAAAMMTPFDFPQSDPTATTRNVTGRRLLQQLWGGDGIVNVNAEAAGRKGSLDDTPAARQLAAATAARLPISGVAMRGLPPMDGELIVFASDLAVEGMPADASAPLDYAVKLVPDMGQGSGTADGFSLSALPLLSAVPTTWLGAMQIPNGMGSIMACTKDLVANGETLVKGGLTFAGWVEDRAGANAAPFVQVLISTLRNQCPAPCQSARECWM
jgi:hypothetical protein